MPRPLARHSVALCLRANWEFTPCAICNLFAKFIREHELEGRRALVTDLRIVFLTSSLDRFGSEGKHGCFGTVSDPVGKTPRSCKMGPRIWHASSTSAGLRPLAMTTGWPSGACTDCSKESAPQGCGRDLFQGIGRWAGPLCPHSMVNLDFTALESLGDSVMQWLHTLCISWIIGTSRGLQGASLTRPHNWYPMLLRSDYRNGGETPAGYTSLAPVNDRQAAGLHY